MAKYVSQENLTQYDELIKQHIDDKESTINQSITTHINDKSNPHNVTKSQVGLGNVDNTSDASKPISTATQAALDKKQNTLVSGTNIKTLNEQSLLGSGNISLDLSLYKVVTTLPTTDIDPNKIYLVLSSASGEANTYTEYVYVNNAWEKLGEYKAEVDLTPYLTKEEASTTYATKTEVGTKVDKIEGKQLSTNDYTDEDKDKLNAVYPSAASIVDLGGDFNTIPPGMYRLSSLGTNYATYHGPTQYGGLLITADYDTYKTQIYHADANDTNGYNMYIREYSNNKWTEWRGIVDANKLEEVKESLTPPYPMNAYGVEWDCTNSSPNLTRIGNMSMHKTLPIQSKLRGCVAKNGEIQYYLDPTDWSKKEDGTPSRLDGYDGTVQVDTSDKFYLWSEEIGNKRRVWISEYKCVPYAYEVPRMLIDAYKGTVLRTVPQNMGYLSTLPANSIVSICNTATYCRGGYNNGSRDQYLTDYPHRTQLGKPASNINLTDSRTYARNAGREVLNYYQYKAILYWLFVIEYATFNEQTAVNDELTSEGYKQGGLGTGVTNLSYPYWMNDNYTAPAMCGYTNDLGNFSGTKSLVLPSWVYPYNQATLYLLGQYIHYQEFNPETSTYQYRVEATGDEETFKTTITKIISTNYAFGKDNVCGIVHFNVTGLTDGQTLIVSGGNEDGGNLTISADGDYTATFTNPKSVFFFFSKTQDVCNIVITGTSTEPMDFTIPQQTTYPNRYRGFENPFGDYNMQLDGILYRGIGPSFEYSNIYVTDNPTYYTSRVEDLSNLTLLGQEKLSSSAFWVKDYNLGYNAELLSRDTSSGGSATTYTGSYRAVGTRTSNLRKLIVGGNARNGSSAGLAYFNSGDGVGYVTATVGFRTVKVLS